MALNFDHLKLEVKQEQQPRLFSVPERPEKILADRLQEHFKKNCWWVINKFGYSRTVWALDQVEKEGSTEFSHLMQKLK